MKRAMTGAQRERQRHRENGKYAQVNPCNGCGKSAGVSYFSHHLTDCDSPLGESWDDLAICLCKKCADATSDMTEPSEFIEYAKKKGGIK